MLEWSMQNKITIWHICIKHLHKHEHISHFLPLVWVGYQCQQLAFVVLPPVSSFAPSDVVAGFHLLFGSLLLMSGEVWKSAHPQRGPPSYHHPTLSHPTLLRYQTWQQCPSFHKGTSSAQNGTPSKYTPKYEQETQSNTPCPFLIREVVYFVIPHILICTDWSHTEVLWIWFLSQGLQPYFSQPNCTSLSYYGCTVDPHTLLEDSVFAGTKRAFGSPPSQHCSYSHIRVMRIRTAHRLPHCQVRLYWSPKSSKAVDPCDCCSGPGC